MARVVQNAIHNQRFRFGWVEKAVTDGPSTQGKTSEMLYEAFRVHVKLKHSEDFNLAAIPATERHQA
jgi:hypothetical protein